MAEPLNMEPVIPSKQSANTSIEMSSHELKAEAEHSYTMCIVSWRNWKETLVALCKGSPPIWRNRIPVNNQSEVRQIITEEESDIGLGTNEESATTAAAVVDTLIDQENNQLDGTPDRWHRRKIHLGIDTSRSVGLQKNWSRNNHFVYKKVAHDETRNVVRSSESVELELLHHSFVKLSAAIPPTYPSYTIGPTSSRNTTTKITDQSLALSPESVTSLSFSQPIPSSHMSPLIGSTPCVQLSERAPLLPEDVDITTIPLQARSIQPLSSSSSRTQPPHQPKFVSRQSSPVPQTIGSRSLNVDCPGKMGPIYLSAASAPASTDVSSTYNRTRNSQ